MTRCVVGSGQSVPLGVCRSLLRLVPCVCVLLQRVGDPGFSVNESAEYKDLELLNRARLRWEEENKKSAQKQPEGQCVALFVPLQTFVAPILTGAKSGHNAAKGGGKKRSAWTPGKGQERGARSNARLCSLFQL